ncbi:nuclear transport factor 2 family protein [Luteimonas sp. Y-2-2-4F]|nr:nuclear transport factor 2 family protein [Luteimonas sp. Y-2-2-4F]MCD9030349.1 nuclear transport factor 2 family protein [Luteimonas sp. Y-2-2-4F]
MQRTIERRTIRLVFVCALALLAACARTPPEEALRQTVDAMQAAVSERDAAAFSAHLAEDFVGPGGMDRDAARRMAALYFLQHARVGLDTGPLTIEMGEGHATVRFTAAATGGGGRLLPDAGQVYQVRTGWRLEDGDWRLTSAEWTTVLGR